MGIDERALAIDGANAVPVAVGAKAGVVFPREDRLAERIDVLLDRFGMRAAEKRVTGAANFATDDTVAFEDIGKQTRGGAMHGVGDEADVGFAEAVPIDKLFDRV